MDFNQSNAVRPWTCHWKRRRHPCCLNSRQLWPQSRSLCCCIWLHSFAVSCFSVDGCWWFLWFCKMILDQSQMFHSWRSSLVKNRLRCCFVFCVSVSHWLPGGQSLSISKWWTRSRSTTSAFVNRAVCTTLWVCNDVGCYHCGRGRHRRCRQLQHVGFIHTVRVSNYGFYDSLSLSLEVVGGIIAKA